MEDFKYIPMIIQPPELKISLYPHQLASVYNMEKIEDERRIIKDNIIYETNIGINSDMLGYGKTLSMITLIQRDKMKWDMSSTYTSEKVNSYSMDRIVSKTLFFHKKFNTTLILANQTIIKQWLEEFSYTSLKVVTVTKKNIADNIKVDEYDVVIVIPALYNRLVQRYYNIAWKRFIYDEPGHIRVPAMKNIYAGFIWFVTATPSSILTQHRNCKGSFMFNIIGGKKCCDYLPILSIITISNPEEFIKQSYKMPPTYHSYYQCYSPLYNTLYDMVQPRIINMIDGNNIDGAIQALGGKKTSNITELVRNRKLEELEEIQSKIKIYTMRDDEERLKEWSEREVRLNNQLKELDRRFENSLSKDCNICFGELKSPVMEPRCQNIWCARCLLVWLQQNNTCPICRTYVNVKDLVYIDKKYNDQEEKNVKVMTKEENIIKIIDDKKDGKFIIFSSYNETFNPICNILKEHNISFSQIKGSIDTIVKRLEQFKSGEIQVIFLNSKYNGAGINLQEASDIIIYHDMGPEMLQQVLGRPNRIGRKTPLNVHHLIYT
jgi:hypothetical protein